MGLNWAMEVSRVARSGHRAGRRPPQAPGPPARHVATTAIPRGSALPLGVRQLLRAEDLPGGVGSGGRRRLGGAACGRGCHSSKVTVTGAWSDQRSGWVAARSTTAETAFAAIPGVASW